MARGLSVFGGTSLEVRGCECSLLLCWQRRESSFFLPESDHLFVLAPLSLTVILMEDPAPPPLDPNDPTLLEEDPEAPAELPPSKPRLLTMRLIAERCLDKAEREQLSAEESAERVIGLTHLRLDRLRIGSMDGLELCNGATHIHLQHNLLREIESLDFFNALQFLVLANNQVPYPQYIRTLPPPHHPTTTAPPHHASPYLPHHLATLTARPARGARWASAPRDAAVPRRLCQPHRRRPRREAAAQPQGAH